MWRNSCFLLLISAILCGGCAKQKTTEELIGELQSDKEDDRLKASRLLPQKSGDAGKIVPGLMASLRDKHGDIRRSAAIGLGYLGDQAREAIPALQAAQRDADARVREAARVALSRIDPARFSAPSNGQATAGKQAAAKPTSAYASE
jgi:hypothetical protein